MNTNFDQATISHIRVKIIKRFGDNWVFLVFFVCCCLIENDPTVYQDGSYCTGELLKFLDLYFYGYIIYLSFLVFTLVGCIYPSLDSVFKRFQILTFVLFFFGIFGYAQWIIFDIDFGNQCQTTNLNLRVFCYFYVIAWYAFLTTRLIMYLMFIVKKRWTRRYFPQDTSGMHLFVDVE